MASPSAHACPAMWRVPTPFVVVLSPSIPVSRILAATEPYATLRVSPSATARTIKLEILLRAAINPPSRWSSASQDRVVAMPTVMWPEIVRNATADPVMWEMPIRDVGNRVALSAIPILVDRMPIVYSPVMARSPASALKVCLETQHH